ncbi:glycosyltransferase family 2 protein [Rubrobacter indicoceani]|uniref:glycosyltransferase family 2 protein n=1 Tax=Rubrobacter indicoceani TaxID=2051957 RepID=UPI000E5B61E6|nr:glycosyltransferase family 2 protein [Rubrobacter indicoceani]
MVGPDHLGDPASGPQIAAVVPSLNEAASIPGVIEQLYLQGLLSEIIVVDNGSTDGTGEVAMKAGARVIREEQRGYGRACLTGTIAAEGAEFLVFLDGDAADDPVDLGRILAPLLDGEADLVVGSRSPGQRERGSMSVQQVFGNRLAAFLIHRIYGIEVTDTGPFRAIRREDLLALGMSEMTYGWPVEMMVKSARAGYRYREVPVTYRRRIGTSKVGGTLSGSLKAGWRIILATLRYSRWSPETNADEAGRTGLQTGRSS